MLQLHTRLSCCVLSLAALPAPHAPVKAREEIKMNDDKTSTRVEKQNSLKAPGQELTQFN